jgi:lysophospholipase L1-like esterase
MMWTVCQAVLLLTLSISSLASLVPASTSSVPFAENDLRYVGRFHMEREHPAADWSGSGITLFVKSEETGGSVEMSLTASVGAVTGSMEMLYYVGVFINCELLDTYKVSWDENVIHFSFLASLDSSIPDEIHIIKLTEGVYSDNQGELALESYSLSSNAQLVTQNIASNAPKSCRNPSKLNLMVIGDSITAAYGVDGVDPCTYSASTQNFLHSYAYLTAQALGAELTTLAWSGKGVVRNYGDPNPMSTNPMPTYYNRTLAPLSNEEEPSNYWDPTRYTPDVVLVMLGSNDYSTTPNPSDEDFTNGLVDFITLIAKDYPTALIGAMCAPSNHGNQCANIENATKITNSAFVHMDSSLYVYPNGCDGHPR